VTLVTNESYVDLTTFIQRQLQDIGINLEMKVVRPGLLREWMANGEVKFFRGSWIADYPDAETYLTVFYGQNPAPPNYTRFKHEQYDSLYQEALRVSDRSERKKYYKKMEQIMLKEAPVVPLYYDEAVRFIQNNVKGLKVNAMNLLDLSEVRLTDKSKESSQNKKPS
jgi:peptide/nickel transport system substrate-binding protein